MNTEKTDSLDQQVNAPLQGSWLGMFLTELFQGAGQLALFLLLLEAVLEWEQIFSKPDVYVLLIVALGLILFYIALDLKGAPWVEGVSDFFTSAPHAFLLALAITQVGALISLALVARRQQGVIVDLLHQLKTLSRWSFGNRVVEAVLRDSDTVNTAKRLCDHAQPGQLLAGPVDWLADTTGPRISIHAKGKSQPVVAALM